MDELDGEYGLVMAHHSFEHMPDPIAAISNLMRLCSRDGTVLLRLPVAGCLAWKKYGVNWYQIDAPRHLVIPSEKGMRLMVQRLQMKLALVEYDSDETQFGCSEQYANGISLRDPRSYFRRRDTPIFTENEKRSFCEHARQANERNEGDQACYYLTH